MLLSLPALNSGRMGADCAVNGDGGSGFAKLPVGLSQIAYLSMFLVFAIGALGFYVALRLRLLFAEESARKRIARYFIHSGARLLFYLLTRLSLINLTLRSPKNEDDWHSSAVIVANHPSMLDAMLLLSLAPNAVCIMKRSLLRIPVVAGFARAAGYIPQAEAPELLRAASQALMSGAAIIVFPEGTRSADGVVGEFQRGAARLAVEAGRPIALFALSMTPIVLGRGRAWWRAPRLPAQYQAVRIARNEIDLEIRRTPPFEDKRQETIRVTRCLEDLVRNSLS